MQRKKILMVCLGNICRSPLAHSILESKINTEKVFIDSAGTSCYHVGNAADERSIKVAKKYGISIESQKSRLFTKEDFKEFDFIFVMDSSNHVNVLKLAESEEDKSKVRLILNEIEPGKNKAVPDPYYGGEDGFEQVYKMLDLATDQLIKNHL